MASRSNWFYVAMMASVIGLSLLGHILDPFPVQALRLIAFDAYQRLGPRELDPDPPVRIVDIDEESLSRYGQWPWPRSLMAELVKGIGERGAASVAFDILFAEPDRTSIGEMAKAMPEDIRASVLAATEGRPSNDDIFAGALRGANAVLAVTLAPGSGSSAFKSKAGFAIAGDDPKAFLRRFTRLTGNLPILEEAASGVGAINWIPDRDQVVRRVPLFFGAGDNIVPSLAAEALRTAQQASTYVLKASNASGQTAFGQTTGLNSVRIGAIETPTDPDGGVWLSFRPSHPEIFIPAWKILANELDPAEIDGRIVLIGTSAPGLQDLRATPLDAAVPGVEIHAQILEHLLHGISLTRPDYAPALERMILALLGIALAFVLLRVSAVASATIGLAVIGVMLIGAFSAFKFAGLLFDPLYPALSVFSIVAVSTYYTYRRSELQRSQVRGAFGRYVAPAVVDNIIANPARLQLGGEVRQLTLLFTDVRNFTSISERMTANELTLFINELLTPLSDIILTNLGTIDKYMGDAIMAFWNAPMDQKDHAARACRTAMQMARAMPELNRKWAERARAAGTEFPPVKIGIGLNTGDCCVGNLGSEQRFDYSAIGDDVNVASRYEGLTKLYSLPAIAGEPTIAAAEETRVLEVDMLRVKGRARPTRIFTFIDLMEGEESAKQALMDAHGDFITAYRTGDWDGALQHMARCRAAGVAGMEDYYTLFEGRIHALRQTAGSDWDGVFIATEK